MRIERAERSLAKGWYAGPWNSDLPVPVGYANAGIDEPHVHQELFEIYLVVRGTSVLRVEQESVELREGDVMIVEPGEAHTFLGNSDDYYHFVLQLPRQGQSFQAGDKTSVERSRLGL